MKKVAPFIVDKLGCDGPFTRGARFTPNPSHSAAGEVRVGQISANAPCSNALGTPHRGR
jgi:hypothetical protein